MQVNMEMLGKTIALRRWKEKSPAPVPLAFNVGQFFEGRKKAAADDSELQKLLASLHEVAASLPAGPRPTDSRPQRACVEKSVVRIQRWARRRRDEAKLEGALVARLLPLTVQRESKAFHVFFTKMKRKYYKRLALKKALSKVVGLLWKNMITNRKAGSDYQAKIQQYRTALQQNSLSADKLKQLREELRFMITRRQASADELPAEVIDCPAPRPIALDATKQVASELHPKIGQPSYRAKAKKCETIQEEASRLSSDIDQPSPPRGSNTHTFEFGVKETKASSTRSSPRKFEVESDIRHMKNSLEMRHEQILEQAKSFQIPSKSKMAEQNVHFARQAETVLDAIFRPENASVYATHPRPAYVAQPKGTEPPSASKASFKVTSASFSRIGENAKPSAKKASDKLEFVSAHKADPLSEAKASAQFADPPSHNKLSISENLPIFNSTEDNELRAADPSRSPAPHGSEDNYKDNLMLIKRKLQSKNNIASQSDLDEVSKKSNNASKLVNESTNAKQRPAPPEPAPPAKSFKGVKSRVSCWNKPVQAAAPLPQKRLSAPNRPRPVRAASSSKTTVPMADIIAVYQYRLLKRLAEINALPDSLGTGQVAEFRLSEVRVPSAAAAAAIDPETQVQSIVQALDQLYLNCIND